MGKAANRKNEKIVPVEIKIIHTDQKVHLKEGQHVITVMFEFNPDKADPEPWVKLIPIAPVAFIGTPDSVAVQIYSLMEVIRDACHCYTGLTGYQKGVLMFRLLGVDGVHIGGDSPTNAMIDEVQRQIMETLQQVSDWPIIERRKQIAERLVKDQN